MVRSRLSRVLSAMLGVVVLSAMLFGGRSYLWCTAMGQAMDRCCCEQPRESKQGPTIERSGCCESKALPTSADTRAAELPAHFTVPGTPYVALEVAQRAEPVFVSVAPAVRRRAPVSGHPRGPPHRLNCVYLI